MSRGTLRSLLAIVAFLLLARGAAAQSAVAGVVTDPTGAVLPGVTVEASSPALIERVRTGVTNQAGQYRIVDLRPGTYSVSFSLPGFSTVVREGIVLEANFTAPINVEMRLGEVTENIVVSGASPVVDVQSSSVRQVIPQDLIQAIPVGRNFQQYANMTPAVSTGNIFDVGGSTSTWTGGSLLVHGSISADSRTMIDGMIVDGMFGNGQCACVYDNENQTQEVAVQVSGGAAEHQLSGVVVNRIPKYGGNQFAAEGSVLYSNGNLQGDNVTAALRDRGMTTPARLAYQYDVNFSLSGPILRDRLWFFGSGRHWTYNNYVADVFNADGSQAVNDNSLYAYPLRLTWQASRRDRLTGLITLAQKKAGHILLSSARSPEAVMRQDQPGEKIVQLKWTSTLTSQLLFEAGMSRTIHDVRYAYQPEVALATCHVAYDLCPPGTGYGDVAHYDIVLDKMTVAPRVTTGAGAGPNRRPSRSQVWTMSLSYISGAHAFKVGVQNRYGWLDDIREGVNGDLNQLYSNGVPVAVEIANTPMYNRGEVNSDLGVYVQNTWTRNRLTLSGGVRWDHFNSSLPAISLAAGRFVPERHFPEVKDLPNWNNVVPRLGAAYDLTGQGKTAVKGNIGLYVQGSGTGFASTYSGSILSIDRRTWNDLNGDNIAQENEIGPSTNLNFGVRPNRNPDPNTSRPYQLVGDMAIDHELLNGLGLTVSYHHRRFYNDVQTRNLAVDPVSDYTLVMIADPRGNGEMLPVYNLAPGKLGQQDLYDTNSSANRTWWRGVDVTLNARLGRARLLGGTSTGRTLSVQCEVADPNQLRFCDETEQDVPFRTQFKLSGSVELPYDLRLGGMFQSRPGSERIINYSVTRAILPTLTQTTVNVRLNEPGSAYNDRVNQLDINLSRAFQSGRGRVRPELALFNVLNTSSVVTQINAFGPRLGNAVTILNPRMLRLSVIVDF